MFDLLFKLSKFCIRLHHHVESFLQGRILDNQFSNVFLLLCQLLPQVVHIFLFALDFILKVLPDTDFMGSQESLHFGSFIFDSSVRFKLEILYKSFRKPELLGNGWVNELKMLILFLHFDLVLLKYLDFIFQLLNLALLLLIGYTYCF